MKLEEGMKQVDFESEDSLIDLILNTESDICEGKNGNGEKVIILIQQNVGLRVSTYQNNGWIRINEYSLETDENREYYIIRGESYEK